MRIDCLGMQNVNAGLDQMMLFTHVSVSLGVHELV